MSEIVLVAMPFGPLLAPSLGLSLLKAGLRREGVRSRVLYLTFPFAERIGLDLYCAIAEGQSPPGTDLAGEWLFADSLFDSTSGPVPAPQAYLDEVLCRHDRACPGTRPSPARLRRLLAARRMASAYLEECADRIAALAPAIVGFTSVFQQHLASLALARRLKQRLPGLFVVLGGANCEGVMGAETVRQFRFVDATVSGEGDRVFPTLVGRVLEDRPVDDLPGVWTRASAATRDPGGADASAPRVANLDDLPFPDYTDFRQQHRRSRWGRRWRPSLFFESSRGCWWGAKQHCTFCGLNGSSMAFRSKSPARAADELTALARRWPGCDIQAVDNIIDMGYFRDLLPELARRRLRVDLFYETKANLRRDQVRALRDAGIRRIQPGIESLSDQVLGLMRKGVRGLQNVQLLKWCRELGVQPLYNLLWGFPGENPEEYQRMAGLVPLLAHLEPPVMAAPLRLDRFSPSFEDAARMGFTEVRPLPAYLHLYPLAPEAVRNLAYYFSYRYADGRDVATYTRTLGAAVARWRRAHAASDLFFVDAGERLWLFDLRPAARRGLAVLSGADRLLYLAADAATDAASLAAACGSPVDATRRLESLAEAGLMLRDGNRFLGLALRLGEHTPSALATRRLLALVRGHGRRRGEAVVLEPEGIAERAPWLGPRAAPARRPPPLTPQRFVAGEGGELLVRCH